jgi:hypothetical protein
MKAEGLYVQYGCGWDAPDGWLNFDASPTLRMERISVVGMALSALMKRNAAPFPDNVRYGDIVRGLPIAEQSCRGIYCSHVLEHLSLSDFRIALCNTRTILKSGGIFRLVLPDLAFYIREYQGANLPTAALDFMRSSGLGEQQRNRGIKGLAREILGNSRHRWMWDYPSIEVELKKAEFMHIRPAAFGDSAEPKFLEVERWERWENSLGVECKRI